MKNIIIIIFFLTFGTLLTAQEVSPPKSSFRIDFLNPGIGGEFQIAPTQTFSANLNFAPQFGAHMPGRESGRESRYYYGLLPTLSAEYRFYLNRQKRIDRGRSVYNNSGFYLAPRARYSAHSIKIGGEMPRPFRDAEFALGGVIGYQKTFKSNLRMDFNLGLGAKLNHSGISPTLMGSIKLSYAIPRKKRR